MNWTIQYEVNGVSGISTIPNQPNASIAKAELCRQLQSEHNAAYTDIVMTSCKSDSLAQQWEDLKEELKK